MVATGILKKVGRPGPGMFVVGAIMFQAGLNFILHTYASRTLGPDLYAQLGVLLNLTLFLAVPLGAVQLATTTATGRAESLTTPINRPATVRIVKRQALLWASLAGILVALATPLLAGVLNLSLFGPVWILCIYVAVSTLGAAWRGVALGRSRFGFVAMTIVIASVVRLVACFMFISIGGVWAAMAITALTECISTFGLLPILRDKGRGPLVRISTSTAFASTAAFTGLWLFTSIDTLLALPLLTGTAAGQYTASATLARSVLMITATLAAVAVPRFAAAGAANASGALRTLRQAVFFGLLLLIIVIPATFFTGPILERLFGPAYTQAAIPAAIMLLGAVFYGIATISVYYLQARKRKAVNIIWVLAAMETITILAYHPSITALAAISLAYGVLGALILTVVAYQNSDVSIEEAKQDIELSPLTIGAQPITDPLWQIDSEYDISVIVPCYNTKTSAALQTVASLSKTLQQSNTNFEIIIVNDGSTNIDPLALETAITSLYNKSSNVRILTHDTNLGKGAALSTGFRQSKGKWVAFVDSDGDIDPDHIVTYLGLAELHKADIVTASKLHPNSSNTNTNTRNTMSRLLQFFNIRVLKLSVADTQVGAKIIHKDVLAAVLPRMYERRFAFDVELFVVADQYGHTNIIEAPVQINRTGSSTVTSRTAARTLTEIAAVWQRQFLGEYHPDTPLPPGHTHPLERAVQ